MHVNNSNNLSFTGRFAIPYKALDLKKMNDLKQVEYLVERILTQNPNEAFQISCARDCFKRSTSKGFISDGVGQKVFDVPDNEDNLLIKALREFVIPFEQMLGVHQ